MNGQQNGHRTSSQELVLTNRPHTRASDVMNEILPSPIAASTPSRIMTEEYIRAMIRADMRQLQDDLSSDRITRTNLLSALSSRSHHLSVRTEAGLRHFVRQQVALQTPEITAF